VTNLVVQKYQLSKNQIIESGRYTFQSNWLVLLVIVLAILLLIAVAVPTSWPWKRSARGECAFRSFRKRQETRKTLQA